MTTSLLSGPAAMNLSTALATPRRFRLTLAVEGWAGGERHLYQPGHALFLAMLRHANLEMATALHDEGMRKPFALGPLHVIALPGGLGKADLAIRVWDDRLAALIERAGRVALDAPLSVVGHSAAVIGLVAEEPTTLGALLGAKCATPAAAVRVEFASPTLFGLGRYVDGSSRYGLLPQPGLVVASWLRAWRAAGGESFGAEPQPGWLDERVALRAAATKIVSVNAGKTALSGFIGTASYVWCGPEPWGPTLLAALARFATFSGTGAKTGQGFGVTLFWS